MLITYYKNERELYITILTFTIADHWVGKKSKVLADLKKILYNF